MNLLFPGARVQGILGVVPATELDFLEDMRRFDFPEAKSLKLKMVMGYDKHRVAHPSTCVSDLAVHGFQHLFAKGVLQPADIDALILVTQSPDYLVPPTSFVIAGRLGLPTDLYCLDINQGCAGYVIGLFQALQLLQQPAIRTVALVNADVLSRRVSRKDKNSWPLAGDAAAITILRADPAAPPVHGNLKCDGSRNQALVIPAGGFRTPSTAETARLEDAGENNWRSLDHLRMDGAGVFNFVMTEVPPMIDALLQAAGVARDSVDSFLFHQPNRFMLHKLADAMGVPHDRMPANLVEKFGNSNSVTIPLTATLNLGPDLTRRPMRLCLAGFGVGLTWGSLLLDTGPLDFCEWIDYPEPGT